jgi:hypothetical protein
MQIFEITQIKKITEINYGAVGRGLAQAAGAATREYFGMQPKQSTQVQGLASQQQAQKLSEPVIKQQAQQQQQLWTRTVQTMKNTAKNAGLSELDSKELADTLMKQLESMLRPHGLKATMDNQAGVPVPTLDDFADQIANNSDTTVSRDIDRTLQQVDDALMAIVTAKDADKLNTAWLNLSQGIANAASLMTFQGQPNTNRAGSGAVGSAVKSGPTTGNVAKAMSALGVRDEDLQGLAQLIQQNPTPVRATGNPVMDDLLRHMGLIK